MQRTRIYADGNTRTAVRRYRIAMLHDWGAEHAHCYKHATSHNPKRW